MQKKIISFLLMVTLSFVLYHPQIALAVATDTERITALEVQIKDLQEQQKQLAEQNRRLLELMQKMAAGDAKIGTQTQTAKQERPSTPAQATKAEPSAVAKTNEPTSAPAETKQRYAPGWLARILDVSSEYNITDTPHPLEVVNFTAIKSEYQVYEYLNLVDGAFRINNPLWKCEAFLMAEEAGDYVFSIHTSSTDRYERESNALKAIYVDDVQINAGSEEETLIGTTTLAPGMYKIEFRVCGKSRPNFKFNLQVKRPSDNNMLPISQVLVLPVPNKAKK